MQKTSFRNASIIAAVAASLLVAQSARATTYYWDTTTTGLWSTGTNWSTNSTGSPAGAVAPTSTDTVVFNGSSVNGNEIVQFNADASIAGMTFSNTGTTLLDSDSATTRTLTIGTSGIAINAGAGAVTIGDSTNALNIALSGSQTWTNNSSNLFTVVNGITNVGNVTPFTLTIGGSGNTTVSGIISNGGVTGTTALTKTGIGKLTLSGAAANTYTGATTVQGGGELVLDFANLATPTNLISSSSALVLGASGGTLTINAKSTGSTAQTFATGTPFNGTVGMKTINLNQNGGSGVTLTLSNTGVTFGAGQTGYINLNGANAVLSSTLGLTSAASGAAANGNIRGDVIVNQNGVIGFAFNNAGSIKAVDGSTLGELLTTGGTGTVNYKVTSSKTLTGNVTSNSFTVDTTSASGGSITQSTFNLGAGSGGMLFTGAGNFAVNGTTGTLGGNQVLMFHQYSSGTVTINALLGNNANAFVKDGTGTLVVGAGSSGAQTYTGATDINAGAENIIVNTGLGTAAGGTTVFNGASLGLDGTAGNLTVGAEALTLFGAGVTASPNGALRNIAGANSFAGAITLGSNATIQSDASTLTLTGGITNAGFTTTFQGAGNTTASTAAITGAGGLTKAGAGTLTLSATNTYSGTTAVNAGTLLVNGTHNGSGAYNINTGTLGGSGSITAAVNVGDSTGSLDAFITGGTAAATGTFTTTGALALNSDATYSFQLNSGTLAADKIVANGVTINSSAVFSLTDLGSTLYSSTQTFLVIDNTSGSAITGTFNGLAQGASFNVGGNIYTVSYVGGTGNDMVLSAIPEPSPWAMLVGGLGMLVGIQQFRRRRVN